ncbi:MAG: alpha/beta fold hydrolase, partial [Candidatus Binatia bacterium]
MSIPETKYAKSGDLHIAYQVVGDGPIDLVFVTSWFSQLEMMWQDPSEARVFDRLASFSRLILVDPRGTGMSDPVPLSNPPTLEERMDDILAVMDAAGSERAAILGASYGGPLSVLFACTHAERTGALVLHNTSARYLIDDNYPIGGPPELVDIGVARILEAWGRPGGLDWLPAATERLKSW